MKLEERREKTKIVVTGSKVDMDYYGDTVPWSLNGERIAMVQNNEHLGLVVSGLNEEQKKLNLWADWPSICLLLQVVSFS